MSIQILKDRLPEYARDLKLNLGSLAAETVLTETQKAGTFVATALAARNPEVIEAVLAEFGTKLDPAALAAARAAAAIMGMNNVYYRFLHLVEDAEYSKLPARLRMNVIATPGTARVDFELWCLAVSAVNACGRCITSHEKVLREAGMTREQIQAAVRIASVVHAVAATLDAETLDKGHVAAAA
ncbi:MAG TPA: carboxymuconolactone decarboxylase family protein [Burkholderiales bacterium]|jgi:alkyl hydroperoxide reductase subunit D|nr:carboxymuconolactone decarboxylase family protein [Burkholderiales bacterium]